MEKISYSISPEMMITSIANSLTKSEQKVAEVVKSRLKEVVYWSVSDLAEQAEVGETTVIRFCRRLGYRGYQDFKLAVAQSATEQSSKEEEIEEVKDTDNVSTLAKKVTSANTNMLQNTMKLIDPEAVERVAEQIIQSQKLYVFGVGASGIMAQQAQYRFMRLGYHSLTAADAHLIAMNSSLAGPGDVVICISTSGSTKDLVDAIKIAKVKGAFIVCITNHMRSPITKYGDVVLLTSTKESPLHGGALSSIISQMHVLDILTRYIELQNKERSQEALKNTAKSVSDKLY
ncbi:MurR/RpiR family transcriptional regulator [Alkalihalobacillus sp. 1P02AB]|uniref:MurR/RpiR family transcriptional regulator n=1 Tax=Alkalihalobacillus sp. 1P02AB TaxID=3132260 RepID=UPI0039A63AA9